MPGSRDRPLILPLGHCLGVSPASRGIRPDGPSVVDRLARRGLLVEQALITRQVVDFGRSHRVVPLVAGVVYRVREWSHPEASRWAGCRTHAAGARCEPESVLNGLVSTLPLLLAFGAAYVDLAMRP